MKGRRGKLAKTSFDSLAPCLLFFEEGKRNRLHFATTSSLDHRNSVAIRNRITSIQLSVARRPQVPCHAKNTEKWHLLPGDCAESLNWSATLRHKTGTRVDQVPPAPIAELSQCREQSRYLPGREYRRQQGAGSIVDTIREAKSPACR